jgi:hypothetical protein
LKKIILISSWPRSIYPDISIRLVRCAPPRTCLWGTPLDKVSWVWIHAIVCGICFWEFHPLWQVADHPASVHGIKIERVPTILSIHSNSIVLVSNHQVFLSSSCTRVVSRVKAGASTISCALGLLLPTRCFHLPVC